MKNIECLWHQKYISDYDSEKAEKSYTSTKVPAQITKDGCSFYQYISKLT